MAATTLLERGGLTVVDYRCEAGLADEPFVERHDNYAVSYVRKGSFGYRLRGAAFELVAGSILVGHAGDEYVCTHDHVFGDECLSFHFDPALVETLGDRADTWRVGSLPPLSELVIVGELGQAAAEGRTNVGLDEVGLVLAARLIAVASGRTPRPV